MRRRAPPLPPYSAFDRKADSENRTDPDVRRRYPRTERALEHGTEKVVLQLHVAFPALTAQ